MARLTAAAADAAAFALAALGLYWAFSHVEAMAFRAAGLALALLVAFLGRVRADDVPPAPGGRERPWLLAALAVLSVAALVPPLADAGLPYRAAQPRVLDLVCGSVAVLLVIEATRRACGLALALTGGLFLLYAWIGPLLDLVHLSLVAHRGYDLPRLVGTLYMTLEGLFGVPLDVGLTFILLFTVFGSLLERSGAAAFFLRFSMAAFGGGGSAGPARTVGAASFLLGCVTGSGVATTLTVGTLAWPLLRRAGYGPETAGALLAASGIGALVSPPTMGAAAFLIAEFLAIPYAKVLAMALVPALLYYVAALVTVEGEAGRLRVRALPAEREPMAPLVRRGGAHFLPLVALVALLATGTSAFRAVLWAMGAALAAGALDPAARLAPADLVRALRDAGRAVTPVILTTACAGIVVGVVGLTGLGLKLSGVLVALAGGTLAGTALLSAVAVGVLGLAVPVTASYVIAAVMIVPALEQVGVPAAAAHMFVFYYAVLSEVTPPTALAPFAAAALTGGDAARTMALTWRYTLPAFLVPLAFVWTADGRGLLLLGPPGRAALTIATAGLGVALLAAGMVGFWRRPLPGLVRALLGLSGVLLLWPSRGADLGGVVLGALALLARARGGDSARRPEG